MHIKEFKKTKNNTGRLTHLSLKNSELYIGESFHKHLHVNQLIDDPANNCYVLYPSHNAINLNCTSVSHTKQQNVIFIIDSTWACSKKMLRLTPKLDALPKISFTHTKTSQYQIKVQPQEHCLSTIESTLCVLELLNQQHVETLSKEHSDLFLEPFTEMVRYQMACVQGEGREIRYKKRCIKKS
jgi:DTW domain-containing protein YfiP